MTTTLPPVKRPPSPVDPIFPLAAANGAVPPAPAWFSKALELKPERTTYSVDGLQIELLTWGEIGKPGLLFGHGYAGHADWWSFVAPLFAQDYRCAAISLSGMGRSQRRPESRYSTVAWARELAAAVDAGALDRSGHKPVLVGQSMAGLVGARAATISDPFSALIAIDTAFNLRQDKELKEAAIIQGHRDRIFPSFAEALARYRLSPDQDCANLYVLDYLARLSLREREGGLSWRLDPHMVTEFQQFWHKDELRVLPCPAAYIYGERSSLVSHRIAELREAFAPSTPFIGIPDADHNILADQPIALITAIRAVLERWQYRQEGRIVL